MPKLKTVERQIERLEKFRVRFKDRQTKRDVKGNLDGISSYPYEKMARNRSCVADWKSERFKRCYGGFDVDVLNANGSKSHGGTLLGTVRDTYLE